MQKSVITLLLINVFGVDGTLITDYCKVNKQNTPCATGCIRSPQCGNTDDEFEPLTNSERAIILDRHNMHRDKVAAGDYAAFQLPSCSGGINALSYDLELEYLASCWIQQCNFAHDKVRLTLAGEKVGQNLHQRSFNVEPGFPDDFFTHAVDAWFNEYKLLTSNDSDLVNGFYKKSGIGHLTALIWGATKYVGCAKMHHLGKAGQPDAPYHSYDLYCNYASQGNYIGAKIYKDKECPKMNEEYPHLCGDIRPIEDSMFEAPVDYSRGNRISNSIFGVFQDLFYSSYKLGKYFMGHGANTN